jgi:hypothetical protein
MNRLKVHKGFSFGKIFYLMLTRGFKPPFGYAFLIDNDGAYIVDNDGVYLVSKI